MKATESQVKVFFEKIGTVNDVIMIRDKSTNRHKGFCYVEMRDLDKVPMVLMLNGTVPDYQKFPILVKASEAEKNFLYAQEQRKVHSITDLGYGPAVPASGSASALANQLFVSNIHEAITEEDLRTVLRAFGEVDSVSLQKSESGRSKGSAFVTYRVAADAHRAKEKVSGLELAGKALEVAYASAHLGSMPQAEGAGSWRLDDDDGRKGLCGGDRWEGGLTSVN